MAKAPVDTEPTRKPQPRSKSVRSPRTEKRTAARSATAAAAQPPPDVVLLDLTMPGLDGLSALPLLREAAPACEVVVLTASGTEDNLLAAIRGGAAGYLLKTESPERIAEFLEGVVH